jgi:hypothetical protein
MNQVDFEDMARPGWTGPMMGVRAADLMASKNLIEAGFAAFLYDQSDKHHFCGSPISPAGDRWDNRRKVKRDGQNTLIV